MMRLKHTKTELKTQRDAFRRYTRFLPMLQLKKQQLQAELQQIEGRFRSVQAAEAGAWGRLGVWVRLCSEPADLPSHVTLEKVDVVEGNLAGVSIPVLRDVTLRRAAVDLLATPPWVDDAAEAVVELTRLRIERETLATQHDRIAEELRTTSQRVNLFEKIKIPECRENIRVIKIFLGDQQTAAVARGKLAKRHVERAMEIE
jgi:V/A-type H+/Na+-transporting ATPase subunit D